MFLHCLSVFPLASDLHPPPRAAMNTPVSLQGHGVTAHSLLGQSGCLHGRPPKPPLQPAHQPEPGQAGHQHGPRARLPQVPPGLQAAHRACGVGAQPRPLLRGGSPPFAAVQSPRHVLESRISSGEGGRAASGLHIEPWFEFQIYVLPPSRRENIPDMTDMWTHLMSKSFTNILVIHLHYL